MKLLINNATIVHHDRIEENISLYIENGILTNIGGNLSADADEIIDAKGLHVLPGLVDAHCHLRDPGFEYKEDIKTGTKSAARGGFTSVACMPNTKPVTDNAAIVEYIVNKAQKEAIVNVYPIGAITKGQEGIELAEMGSMKEAGIVAVSDDGKPVMNGAVMKKALIYASQFNLPVISHCEDTELADGGSMNEGILSTIMGLRGIPSVAEDLMVSRELLLSEYTKVPVHIAHISTKTSVELVRQAKRRGVAVTAETCPHYFTLTEDACKGYNTNAKMNPPLRSHNDLEAIIEGLKDGTLDIIATDHAPHHKDEKNVEFEQALNGIVGFETALALTYTHLVEKGHLTLSDLVKKLSYNPSRMLKINKGELVCGEPADLIMVDFGTQYKIETGKFASKSKNSPYDGFMVKGVVIKTIVNGRIVFDSKENS